MRATTMTSLMAAQTAISNYLRTHRLDCGLCGADNKTHHTAECPLSVLVDAARRARATQEPDQPTSPEDEIERARRGG